MSDIAHLLFPTDAPVAPNPDMNRMAYAQEDAALRLSRRAEPADKTDAAAALFGGDAKQGATEGDGQPPAGPSSDHDAAGKMFNTDAAKFDPAAVTGFTDGFAQSAIADGDIDRAHELQAAGDALVADFKAAGTDADEVKSALDIVRERQGDTLGGAVSEEKLEADRVAAMNELTSEGISDADLNAARAFIRDLEMVAPGTIRTLETSGAGNDPRLIRKAIAEAKRRGYR